MMAAMADDEWVEAEIRRQLEALEAQELTAKLMSKHIASTTQLAGGEQLGGVSATGDIASDGDDDDDEYDDIDSDKTREVWAKRLDYPRRAVTSADGVAIEDVDDAAVEESEPVRRLMEAHRITETVLEQRERTLLNEDADEGDDGAAATASRDDRRASIAAATSVTDMYRAAVCEMANELDVDATAAAAPVMEEMRRESEQVRTEMKGSGGMGAQGGLVAMDAEGVRVFQQIAAERERRRREIEAEIANESKRSQLALEETDRAMQAQSVDAHQRLDEKMRRQSVQFERERRVQVARLELLAANSARSAAARDRSDSLNCRDAAKEALVAARALLSAEEWDVARAVTDEMDAVDGYKNVAAELASYTARLPEVREERARMEEALTRTTHECDALRRMCDERDAMAVAARASRDALLGDLRAVDADVVAMAARIDVSNKELVDSKRRLATAEAELVQRQCAFEIAVSNAADELRAVAEEARLARQREADRLQREREEVERRKAEVERLKREEEGRLKKEAEERLRKEEEARLNREAEERRKRDAEEFQKREAEERRRQSEEEERRKRAEEERRRHSEEEERRKREEDERRRQSEEEERRKRAEEERRKREGDDESRKRLEEERRSQTEFEGHLVREDGEQRRRVEADDIRKREAEERRRKFEEEEARIQQEEDRLRKLEADELRIREEEEQDRRSRLATDERSKQEAEAASGSSTQLRLREDERRPTEPEAQAHPAQRLRESIHAVVGPDASRRPPLPPGHTQRPIDRTSAAVRIQACFRGYSLRKRLLSVLQSARYVDDDGFDYGEVDLATLDFADDDTDARFNALSPPMQPPAMYPQQFAAANSYPPGGPTRSWAGAPNAVPYDARGPVPPGMTYPQPPRPPYPVARPQVHAGGQPYADPASGAGWAPYYPPPPPQIYPYPYPHQGPPPVPRSYYDQRPPHQQAQTQAHAQAHLHGAGARPLVHPGTGQVHPSAPGYNSLYEFYDLRRPRGDEDDTQLPQQPAPQPPFRGAGMDSVHTPRRPLHDTYDDGGDDESCSPDNASSRAPPSESGESVRSRDHDITYEWGFKEDSAAAQAFLKRTHKLRKMKQGAARRKKHADPGQRLSVFRRLSENQPTAPTAPPPKKPSGRPMDIEDGHVPYRVSLPKIESPTSRGLQRAWQAPSPQGSTTGMTPPAVGRGSRPDSTASLGPDEQSTTEKVRFPPLRQGSGQNLVGQRHYM